MRQASPYLVTSRHGKEPVEIVGVGVDDVVLPDALNEYKVKRHGATDESVDRAIDSTRTTHTRELRIDGSCIRAMERAERAIGCLLLSERDSIGLGESGVESGSELLEDGSRGKVNHAT